VRSVSDDAQKTLGTNIQFIAADVAEDFRRISHLLMNFNPEVSMANILSVIGYQAGIAAATCVHPSSYSKIGARAILDAQYNFARGMIHEMQTKMETEK
jgi:hypothetical protein